MLKVIKETSLPYPIKQQYCLSSSNFFAVKNDTKKKLACTNHSVFLNFEQLTLNLVKLGNN